MDQMDVWIVGWSYNYLQWLCSLVTWCNGYHQRKWLWQMEFKSWTSLFTFLIPLISLGKVWILLFAFQLWVNSKADWVLEPWYGNWSRRRKTLNSNLLNSVKQIDLESLPPNVEEVVSTWKKRRLVSAGKS